MSHKWVKQWKVSSWKPDGNDLRPTVYTVSVSFDGVFGCSCPHWKFRRVECKHIQEIKAQEGWVDGDPAAALKLTALRVEKLKAKGKTDKEIEKDLTNTFVGLFSVSHANGR